MDGFRDAEPGHYYWRITQWIMPWYTMVPPYGDNALNAHAWVPIDDENCFTWTFTYHPTRPLSAMELVTMRKGGGIHVEMDEMSMHGANDCSTPLTAWRGNRRDTICSAVAGCRFRSRATHRCGEKIYK